MKKLPVKRLQPAQYKRTTIAISALLVLLLTLYAEVIRPNQDAKVYVNQLDTSSRPLESCFTDLSQTTQLGIFYAPDIAIEEKRQDTATILDQINTCRAQLNTFDEKSHQLANLHLSGYTPSYQQAKVYQRQAFDIIGQSDDVMNQYAKMANFLSVYYDHIIAFTTYTNELQTTKSYLGNSQLTTIKQQADDLRQRAVQIGELDAPSEFKASQKNTASMLSNAATGLDNVVSGYRFGNDYLVTSGYQQVDQAIADYDSHVINLPFQELTKSYIPRQVNQLPGKVANLLSSSSE
jgi:hypothetical protein